MTVGAEISVVDGNLVVLGTRILSDVHENIVLTSGQSLHPMAEYHGAARAVGGCAIYVSDEPGNHDFALLRKLALPDGSILRAKLPGRPTKDCLFSDPARDGKNLLKIWNVNDYTGVIGVFNCQGAGWCKVEKTNSIHDEQPCIVTVLVRSTDVDCILKVASDGWEGDAIVYAHVGGDLTHLPHNASLPITLKSRKYEVFTVVPVEVLSNGTTFTPIGLVKMFNSGGAIKELSYERRRDGTKDIKVRGCGSFGAYVVSEARETNGEFRGT